MDSRRRARLFSLLFVLAPLACAPTSPFLDRQVLWRDPDDLPIPVPAHYRATDIWGRAFAPLVDAADRGLALDLGREALDVNALDEVPDSSWFTNRGRLSPEILAGGPLPPADPRLPLTVVSGKSEGASAGFVALDALGVKYLIKLDPPGWPGLASGADVVGSRLFHAMGWNVPADAPIEFSPGDVKLSPRARLDGRYQDSPPTPLGEEELATLLARGARLASGRIRGVASRFIPGEIIGQWSYLGRRSDDPNDRIPHQDRRVLRGMVVPAAWINNVDTLETNTLDAYVGPPGRGHLVHYLIDFGSAFASYAVRPMEAWMGYEGWISGGPMLESLFTLGIGGKRFWEHPSWLWRRALLQTTFPELGGFSAEGFDFNSWAPLWRNPAFARATARDRLWGAKLVARIDRESLRASIAAADYSPEAAARLEDVLWQRRQTVVRAGLEKMAALDRFSLASGRLCFADIWIEAGLGVERGALYRYLGTLADGDHAASSGRCVDIARRAGVHPVTIRVRRTDERSFGPAIRIWIADGERVVGIER